MKFKDSRVKVINEILNGIKVIKLYAWENHFIEAVFGIRRDELKELRSSAFLSSVSRFMFSCAAFFVSGCLCTVACGSYVPSSCIVWVCGRVNQSVGPWGVHVRS